MMNASLCLAASSATQRSPGLDVARSIAIGGVLAAHSILFFEPLGFGLDQSLPLHIWGGFLGVELFFVLSGLLIGQILFRTVLPACSWRSVGIFWMRRWMRTLPAYYAVLVVLVLVSLVHNQTPEALWRYLVFLQNSPPELSRFFPVSWSLSIEQWAYIGIPLGLWGTTRLFSHTASWWNVHYWWLAALLGSMLLSCLLRAYIALEAPSHWDNDFRKQVPLRLDAIIAGVLIAWIKIYAPRLFAFLSHWLCFIFCGLGLIWLSTSYDMNLFDLRGNVFLKAPAFTLADVCCATMLCFLDANPYIRRIFAPHTPQGKIALWGSRYAYALYLVHYGLFSQLLTQVTQSSTPKTSEALLWLSVAWIVSLAGAFALYHLVEKPCMDARRYLPLH